RAAGQSCRQLRASGSSRRRDPDDRDLPAGLSLVTVVARRPVGAVIGGHEKIVATISSVDERGCPDLPAPPPGRAQQGGGGADQPVADPAAGALIEPLVHDQQVHGDSLAYPGQPGPWAGWRACRAVPGAGERGPER